MALKMWGMVFQRHSHAKELGGGGGVLPDPERPRISKSQLCADLTSTQSNQGAFFVPPKRELERGFWKSGS